MATTVNTLLERLAYRLNEDSSPSDVNENARRIAFLSEAQRKVMGESYWWFTAYITSFPTVADQEIYSLASDFRDMLEVRVDRKVASPISTPTIYNNFDYPPLNYDYDLLIDRWWIFGDSELHLLPVPSSAPTTFTLSSLTSSSGVATGTTSSAHGLKVGDYITVSGANETDYNGVFRLSSIPSTTTFTYSVENSPSSPATGTISMYWNNVVYRYMRQHTDFTTGTDTTIIPDRFTDILVAYALGRKMSGPIEDERGSSADAFEEYNQILKDMKIENNRKKFFNKQFLPRSYRDTVI